MGLHISAYETIELVEGISLAELQVRGWEHPLYDDGVHAYLYASAAAFRDRAPADGFYRISGRRHGFGAGSYSGYNRWREKLAELVGTTPERVWAGEVPVAFGELINFSDCEGVLDTKTCAKLAKDFAEWQPHVGTNGWFADRYADWRKAFELAAGGGAVKFH